jgi:hypothetical protein
MTFSIDPLYAMLSKLQKCMLPVSNTSGAFHVIAIRKIQPQTRDSIGMERGYNVQSTYWL